MKGLSRAFVIAALSYIAACMHSARAAELVFTSWGGAYQDAVRDAWLTPFSRETGIRVLEDTGPSLAKIRAMVETGSVTWDVVASSGVGFAIGARMNLFEPITDAMVDQSHVIPGARNPYGVPSEIFATVVGYSTRAFPHDPPRDFADFWNVAKYPGERLLPALPTGVLEAALLADGVPPDQVYARLSTEEGLARALDMIRAIRPHVTFWWSSAAQVVQALASGDGVMALGWSGRFQDGIDAGLPIAMSWGQSIMQVGYFMILKGGPDKENALALLRYIASAQAQSRLSHFIAYGPTRTDALPLVDPARRDLLPSTPERLRHGLFVDIGWWATHGRKVTQLYTDVMEGG